MDELTAERGAPAALGATVHDDGIEFAVYSENADDIYLCLFSATDITESRRFRLPGRQGGVCYGFAPGLQPGTRYGFRAKGPYQPTEGHRFDFSKLLVDPYARALDRPFVYSPALATAPEEQLDSAPFVPRALAVSPSPDARPLPFRAPGFTYELLVKGFSQRNPGVSAEKRGTLAALAEPAVLDHFARIGIDTIELMPIAAWLGERHLHQLGLSNVWGYNPITHMAPDPRLAPGGLAEVRRVVEALHARGIRVLLDVVFNHSGEADETGPTVCFRGLDNKLYYRTPPDNPGLLINDTGCGNTFAVDRPPVARYFVDVLRSWVETTGIDGFRYDLATVLGRLPDGFSIEAPFFRMVAADPVLKDRIHVAEPWDIGPGGYQVGSFPPSWFEWQDRFRDDVRRFWRGDAGLVGTLATRIAGSADIYDRGGRKPSAGFNFVAAHDGFSLADLTAYVEKHNRANGENNRDGHNDNHSWNHGVEGETKDPAIVEARRRDVRAMMATVLLARGTPMIVAGDEFGRSQKGNNNGYCQDNETVWLDWAKADEKLIAFTGRLAALRKRYPALSLDRFLTGAPIDGDGVPDVVWLKEDGKPLAVADWTAPDRRFLGMALHAPASDPVAGHNRVLVYFNAAPGDARVRLPLPGPTGIYRLALSSDAPDLAPRVVDHRADFVVRGRSVAVLIEENVSPA
ncbi:glycogen debranching protein GlgX [Consotaella salsifontis]|uniref:Glycogen operon protein n=1 Tax=Consotaella salsifontis TaxID=1365950 RepID=A0A1T4PXT9_9HYPH|nr:glycogen debranching protein GlgX [Consotaella salsifontis]SJZ96313.1 glycogen operon protein [Consotaella salsifontis]